MRRSDVLFVAFGVFGGCVTYEVVPLDSPDDGGVAYDGSFTDSNADSNDEATVADASFELSVPDSSPPIDAMGEKPPIDAAGCTCDCDKDGFKPSEAGIACAVGVGLGDCDDLDPRAFPDAGFRTDQPTPDTRGDWNCDGKVVRQYNVNIDCSQYNGVPSCGSIEGFLGDPACGQASTYVHCAGLTLTCSNGSTESRTQGCK